MMPGSKMQGFPGFPDGKQRLTPIPNLFFSDLMPTIDNLAELKVTLYAFWSLGQREGLNRFTVGLPKGIRTHHVGIRRKFHRHDKRQCAQDDGGDQELG